MTNRVEDDREQRAAWNAFLLTLSQVINLAQLLEPDNKNMTAPLERAQQQLTDLLHTTREFSFQQLDQAIFVNDQRLRSDGPTHLRHQQLLHLLGARQIGGLIFHRGLTREEWKGFALAVARYRRDSGTPFQDCRRQIATHGLERVVELLPISVASQLGQAKSVRQDQQVFAARTVAKTMALLRVYLAHLDDPRRGNYYQLKLSRSLQDLITVCLEHSWKYLGLVNIKCVDEYLYNHAVNVALLSLILGVEAGLKRAHLHELGMAALLHDVGKACLPPGLLRKPGPLTSQEREQLSLHPILGVQTLLKQKHFTVSLLKRLIVLCEHHQPVHTAPQHVYSRIIAVAETFDALTSDRPYRRAFLPDIAMKHLITLAGQRLDADLVRAFVRRVGLFPCGTCVELNSGESAVVFHPNPDPKMWMSPIVRVVRDAQGTPLATPQQLDLSEDSDRHILRTLDPKAHGISVPSILSTVL